MVITFEFTTCWKISQCKIAMVQHDYDEFLQKTRAGPQPSM